MTPPKSLVIVQPYIPQYRVLFFEKLIAKLQSNDITCKIAASNPPSSQRDRGDAVAPDWVMPINQRRLAIGGKSVGLGGARPAWKGADGVIVGHLGSSLDTYLALADARVSGLRVGLWGHIKSYVNRSHPVDAALERWQLRLADHVFAYTPGGAKYAENVGVPSERVTTVMNALDDTSLARAIAETNKEDAFAFAKTHGLKDGSTLAFIGGLDESKRIRFLVEALDELWSRAPHLKILVGGQGSQSDLLEPAAKRGQVILLGFVGPAQQALMARNARALLMPGRVGLVAVDALILKLPIITTDWPFHSAELEYLVEGVSKITTSDNPRSYANAVHQFVSISTSVDHTKSDHWNYPSLDKMVDNYARGVIEMLSADGRRTKGAGD